MKASTSWVFGRLSVDEIRCILAAPFIRPLTDRSGLRHRSDYYALC